MGPMATYPWRFLEVPLNGDSNGALSAGKVWVFKAAAKPYYYNSWTAATAFQSDIIRCDVQIRGCQIVKESLAPEQNKSKKTLVWKSFLVRGTVEGPFLVWPSRGLTQPLLRPRSTSFRFLWVYRPWLKNAKDHEVTPPMLRNVRWNSRDWCVHGGRAATSRFIATIPITKVGFLVTHLAAQKKTILISCMVHMVEVPCKRHVFFTWLSYPSKVSPLWEVGLHLYLHLVSGCVYNMP